MAESTKSRGANFSTAELNQLVASWLCVSHDPIVGNGQKLASFWDRVLGHYNENRPQDRVIRNVRSLESKWSDLKRDVARFSGCFQTVKDKEISGTSLEDTIAKAKELYTSRDSKGKDFMYIAQWHMLKECPRFAMTIDDMAQKQAQKKARKKMGQNRLPNAVDADKENLVPNSDGVIDLENQQDEVDGQKVTSNESSESLHYGEKRPIGNKMAKKHRADESSTKIMAAAHREMAAISAKRLKLAETLAAMQEKERDRADRDRLLSRRVADVDPEVQEYFRMCRAKELRIAMLKLQREEEEELRQLRGACNRTPLPHVDSPQAPPTVATTISAARESEVASEGVDPIDINSTWDSEMLQRYNDA